MKFIKCPDQQFPFFGQCHASSLGSSPVLLKQGETEKIFYLFNVPPGPAVGIAQLFTGCL